MTWLKRFATHENLFYLLFWVVLFSVPLFGVWVHLLDRPEEDFMWIHVWHVWEPMLALLLAFLIHNWFIAPILIIKKRTLTYVLSVAVLLGVFMIYQCNHHPADMPPRGPDHGPEFVDNKQPANAIDAPSDLQQAPPPHKPPLDMHSIIAFSMLFLTLAANTGAKYYFKTRDDSDRLAELQQERLSQELEYLKYQVNPHFFMNTLNNIHALVDIDPGKAKNSIVKLSHLMRYLLYESSTEQVPLQHNIDFLRNYIDMMQMRYSDKVDISLDVPDKVASVNLPPLLMIPFLENAFKHGVSYAHHSFIHVKITLDPDLSHLTFTCVNSQHTDDKTMQPPGGIGVPNVIQRLNLLFGDNYTLDTSEDADEYRVKLIIPLIKSSNTLTNNGKERRESNSLPGNRRRATGTATVG